MNCPRCNREMKYGSLQNTNTSHMLGLFVPEGDISNRNIILFLFMRAEQVWNVSLRYLLSVILRHL